MKTPAHSCDRQILPPRATTSRPPEHFRMIHELVDWFLHSAAPWIIDIAQAHHEWCFPIAFLVAFLESFVGISFLVPGTFILISLGTVIGAGHISVIPAWTGAMAGAVAGDTISYWIGFHYRSQIRHVWPFNRFETQIDKGLHFFHDWGAWAVFFGRFLGPFRATVPLVAGVSELEFWPFQIANIGSAIVWAYALLSPAGALMRHFMP
jgi:membrane protein DedA with SNARE-associated domain